MQTGTVKWFNTTKGYGFIAPEGGGELAKRLEGMLRAADICHSISMNHDLPTDQMIGAEKCEDAIRLDIASLAASPAGEKEGKA